MGIFDNIQMALTNILSNKMRSLLTMLGIIIGIGAVIAIQTVGSSLTGTLNETMSSGFGASNITVSVVEKTEENTQNSGISLRQFNSGSPTAKDRITEEMIREYREAFPDKVRYIECTESVGTGTMTSMADASTTVSASITGVNLDCRYTKSVECVYGRFLNEADMEGEKMLAVVADRFVQDALDCSPADAVGRSFRLKTGGSSMSSMSTMGYGASAGGSTSRVLEFYIVGVYHYEEDSLSSMFGSSQVTTTMYIPLTTARSLNSSDPGYRTFTVVPAAGVEVQSFLSVTGDFFASYYTRNESFTATASSMASMLESMTEMMDTVSLAISAVAAIALLVGGIGVMNIMTVSVTERTREIGTRKALGAPGSAIRLQFIVEAMVVCLIGGVLGVAVGVGLGGLCAKMLGFAARPSLNIILVAVGFSMGIGVFFGYYPANKAAKMNPIDALRYE